MAKKCRQRASSTTTETNFLGMNIRRTALSLAVAAALPGVIGMPSSAFAQDSDDDAIEEIVTIGVRMSILDSLATKRNADTIADVVDAGPLGVLPDQSIADALGRMPGVTTIRDSGQSSQLNIRGMNGDFIQTTLNGREQVSTAGYSEATRWSSFDQYPAELFAQAAVYKSPKASQIEGGVAGLVELKTANPLDAEKDHNFVASARASLNDAADSYGGDDSGMRYTLAYQGKFADDTVGFAAGYSFLDQPNAFVFSRAGADSQLGYGSRNINGTDVAVPRAFQWQSGNGNDERIGYLASLVWAPNDRMKATVDYFHSDFERGDRRQGITVGGIDEDEANSVITNPVVTNGILTSATVTATDPNLFNQSHPWFEARTEDQTTTADSETIGLNLEWHISDSSTLSLDYSTGEGEKTREDRIASMHPYLADGSAELPGTSFTYQLNSSGVATGNFGGFSFDDPSAIRLSRYERYPHLYTDEIDTFRVDFKQDLEWGAISSVEAGVRISDRLFGADRGTFLYGSRSGQGTGWCEDNTSSLACEPQSVAGFVGTQSLAGVPDHFVITDINGLGDAIFGVGNSAGIKLHSRDWTFIESNDIQEDTEAFYLMANLDFEWGDVPVSGNVGVRYVRTDVKTIGLQNVGAGNGTPITDGVGVTQDNLDYVSYGPDYTDTLPSLNLNFHLTDNDILRFAAAKVMGRPPVGQMKGGAGSWNGATITDPQDPNFGLTEYNVWTNGTPYLDPFRANQFDISYEHYFEDGGAVTAAVFWKDIESLVEGPTQFTGDDIPPDLGIIVPPGQFLALYQTFLNNDKGGYIRGIEIAGTKTFDTLPGIFAGLGATASYSYTESETEVSGGSFYSRNLPLPGLSENVWSATLFWDIDRFSSHINMRYRDDFVQNLAVPGANSPTLAQSYTTVDAQVSYAFDNGISVVISGNNLTDEENTIEYGVDDAFGEFKQFGRQYYFGINYKY
ncbi:MAG: TonB-dependent receptor [Gammaproteobacteria bacterium]|nr:TonB-dependent receptor [Gammaproteobacteria bacterium]